MYFAIKNNKNTKKHIKALTKIVNDANGTIITHDYNSWTTVDTRDLSGYVANVIGTRKYELCVYLKNNSDIDYRIPINDISTIYGV